MRGLNSKSSEEFLFNTNSSILVFLFNILFISFFSFGSLIDSFTNSIIVFFSALFLFYKNYDKSKFNLDIILILILLLIFFLVNYLSILDDVFRTWSRLFVIIAAIFYGISSFYFFKNNNFFFLLTLTLTLLGFVQCLILFFKLIFSFINPNFIFYDNLYFFGNIRHFSTYLSICFLSGYLLIFICKKNFTLLIVLSFIFSFLLFLGSRSSFLSLAISCGLFSYFTWLNGQKTLNPNFFLVISSLFFYSLLSILNRGFNYIEVINRSMSGNITSGRTKIWTETWSFIEKRVWGYGGDAFVQLEIGVKALGGVFVQTHNVFLQIWIEWGVVSLCIILLLFYRLCKRLTEFWQDRVVFSLSILILNLLIISLFDGVFYYYHTLLLLFIFIAMLSCRLYKLENKINIL